MSIIFRFRYIISLILIPLLLVLIWFKSGLIIGKGEEGLIFYNPSKNFELSSSTWTEINTGMPNLYWLPRLPILYIASFLDTKLNLPPHLIQAGLFYLLMLTGILSMYYLIRSFLRRHPSGYLISFISALFYLFNPFSVSQVWGRGLYPQYFSFALFPLSLLLLVCGLNKRKHIYLILLLFSSAIYSWAFGIVTTVVCYWVILGGYFIWWLITNRLNKRDIFSGFYFMILFFFGWLLINAWWFLPFIIEGDAIFAGYLSQSSENLGTLLGVSRSFPLDVIIRLLQKGYFFDATAYSQIYSTFPFQLISLLPPILVLIGVIKVIKNLSLLKFRFFVFIMILGLIVSLGANPPFGKLFVLVFKSIIPLQAFRNPFEKFGLVYVLGYTPFFAYGLVCVFEKLKLKFLVIFIILVLTCGIYAWPLWTGRVLAGIDNKIGVKVPQYYEDLNEWLEDNDSENFRLFMTPITAGEGAVFQWGSSIYNGVDPMHFLLNRSAVSNGAQIPFYFDFTQNIRKYMEREDLAPALSLLRTKWLIDRKDAISVTGSEKLQYKFLTSEINSPKGVESNLTSICKNIEADSKDNGLALAVCSINPETGDLSKIKYLHLKLKTNIPAYLEISLRDTNGTRLYWHGRTDPDYRTDTADWHNITLFLSTPTENDSSVDLTKSEKLEVWAYTNNNPEKSVGQINIAEIKLDPGIQQNINEFKKVADFGKLTVFEPINFNSPPEFGTLSSVNKVYSFAQLFDGVSKKRDQIHKEGFILIAQNENKKLQDLDKAVFVKTNNKNKISNTRYWIKVDPGQGTGLLILSKTFNSQWKVIPNIPREKLSGGFFDDIDLLKKVILPEENHFVVNGYANLWYYEDNQDQFAIVFLPQVYADLGIKISVTSIGIFILIWMIYCILHSNLIKYRWKF